MSGDQYAIVETPTFSALESPATFTKKRCAGAIERKKHRGAERVLLEYIYRMHKAHEQHILELHGTMRHIEQTIQDQGVQGKEQLQHLEKITKEQDLQKTPNFHALVNSFELRTFFAFLDANDPDHNPAPQCKDVPPLFVRHDKLSSILQYIHKNNGEVPTPEVIKTFPKDHEEYRYVLIAWRLAVEFFHKKCPRMFTAFEKYAQHFIGASGSNPKLECCYREDRNVPALKQKATARGKRHWNVMIPEPAFLAMCRFAAESPYRAHLDFTTEGVAKRPLGKKETVYQAVPPASKTAAAKKRKASWKPPECPPPPKVTCDAEVPPTYNGLPCISFTEYKRRYGRPPNLQLSQ